LSQIVFGVFVEIFACGGCIGFVGSALFAGSLYLCGNISCEIFRNGF
jgi:uncharacterized membrane protein YgdD (TMEM256/DUF423 family)